MTDMVKLGDLLQPVKSARAGDSEYPLLSMTMHNGLVDQFDKFNKRVASQDTSAYKVIERGQLVVGFPIDEGVLDFQTMYDEAIVSPAYGVWELSGKYEVSREYLGAYLRSDHAIAYYKAKLQGILRVDDRCLIQRFLRYRYICRHLTSSGGLWRSLTEPMPSAPSAATCLLTLTSFLARCS